MNQPLVSDDDMKFPVITISISYDDMNEPIHVDLGSVPPFIAASVLEKVLSILKILSPNPRVTFNGTVIAEPSTADLVSFDEFLKGFSEDDEDGSED